MTLASVVLGCVALVASQPPAPRPVVAGQVEQRQGGSNGGSATSRNPASTTGVALERRGGPQQDTVGQHDQARLRWWTDPNSYIAAFTLVLVWFTGLQLRHNWRSEEHIRTVERAYVSISQPRDGLMLLTNNEFHVRVTVTNRGTTPADILGRFVDVRVDGGAPRPPRPEIPPHAPSAVLMPTEQDHVTARITFMIHGRRGEEITQSVRDGMVNLMVTAWVIYRDRFGAVHRSAYAARHAYSPFHQEDGTLVFQPDWTETYEETLRKNG